MKNPSDNKPKLLVVDDEPDNLDLLYRTFHREFKVLRAENGPIALDLLAKEGDIAVIISDQRMPLMSGTEFLSLTATQYPDIIRIILTGYTDVEDLVEAINSGKVFKYVTKPWDDEELKGVVRQAADTHNVLKTRTRELRRSLRQESLLNAVTSTIRSDLSYRQILQTIGETVGQILEVSSCVVRPFQDGQMDDDWFVYVEPSAATDVHHLAKLKAALSQTVWETREIQVIQDVERDDRWQGNAPELQQRRQAYAEAGIRSSLLVPLVCQQELMAVLALHQCGEPRRWQDDEVQLLRLVADQAALALFQARTYEQVRALAKREALINTITTAIRSSLDPQEIFAAITQQLGQALHADGCALSLWTQEDEFVQLVGLHDAAHSGWTTSMAHEHNGLSAVAVLPVTPLPAEGDGVSRPLPQSTVPIEGKSCTQATVAHAAAGCDQ